MPIFAHHVAVEILGREFSPHTPLEHICTFGGIALIAALACYGGFAVCRDLAERMRARRQVRP
jgi:hypothetical protein